MQPVNENEEKGYSIKVEMVGPGPAWRTYLCDGPLDKALIFTNADAERLAAEFRKNHLADRMVVSVVEAVE